jgi:two-component system response regulator HydG
LLEEEAYYAARSTAKVLITGESGVGKELVARLIHQSSAASSVPLVALNCSGIPETLLESELFGHLRGSFTGAYQDKPGLLRMADGGMVFLDEIGEMSPRMQSLLLRFLESGELQPIGAVSPSSRVNVRVVCATNRDLVQKVEGNEFRADLYYRLNVIHLVVPPLRARREDISVLFEHFLNLYSDRYQGRRISVSPEAVARLVEYPWPGNVRELKNFAERLAARGRVDVVEVSDLPHEILAGSTRSVASEQGLTLSKAETLLDRMLGAGESFWSAVHTPFLNRDLTRDDIRFIVSHGLEKTRGNYRVLVECFNMPASDYRRFLNFLRKYECHQPFLHFRSAKVEELAKKTGDPHATTRMRAG